MTYMLIDTSNVVKAGIYNGVDKEHGRKVTHPETGKQIQVNSAEYGFDSAVRFLKARLEQFGLAPIDMIFVTEMPNANTLRRSIWSEYKAGRGSDHVAENHVEVRKAEQMLLDQFLALGARSCTQSGLEADDMIAYLAGKLPSSVVLSTDKDMLPLIRPGVQVCSGYKVDENPLGPFHPRYVTLYKALVGDTSDNIKGAKGFGDKAFLNLWTMWGDEGLDEMIRMIGQRKLEELHENVEQLKALQRVIDDRDGVYRSWQLAQLYVDKVNTFRSPLQWRVGMVKPATKDTHPDLLDWTARAKIVHQGNFEKTLEWARAALPAVRKVQLDIETSGCDESDEWLERKKKKSDDPESRDNGVDVLGHTLTGMGMTFGDNDQFSVYLTVDHVPEEGIVNLTKEQVAQFIAAVPREVPIIVHNAAFELSVMHREVGHLLLDNGWHGFLPNVHDTRIMASYVDEEQKQNLKLLSKALLGYDQVTYQEVTQGRRMNQMRAREVLAYGTDDTVCTAALYNHLRAILEIEQTWETMLEVEQAAAYLGALSFNQGTPVSMERLLELEREDREAYQKGWEVLREYLIAKGWAGTVCPVVTDAAQLTAAYIKDLYCEVTGLEREKKERTEPHAFLDSQVRTPEKLVALLRTNGDDLFAAVLEKALAGDLASLNAYLKQSFKNEPVFSIDSPPQCARLMYEVMKVPVRIRNNLTDDQRAAGKTEGNPKADDYAMQWAIQDDLRPGDEAYLPLKALQAMKVANTRRKLYYEPYRNFPHWTDGLVHSSLNQCGPVTRRYSDAGPNKQQLPKNRKATGEKPRFREVYVPHHKDAVVVSLDFESQELVIIGDYSRDPGLLACLIGEHKKKMHAMTGGEILKKKALKNRVQQLFTLAGGEGEPDAAFIEQVAAWRSVDYDGYMALKSNPAFEGIFKALYELGKKTNFTTEYGAQKKRLSQTLLVPEDEAQEYLEARQVAFPRAEAWKQEVITGELHELGYVTTKMGARRHFGRVLQSGSKYEIGAAERQAVNFKIQSSAAEQTKLAMGRFWKAGLCFRYDARFIGPIHDEVVFSVAIVDLIPFLKEAHALMVAPYGGMFVPISSSISFGLNFGEQIEVGNTVNEAVIRAELAKLFPANDNEYREAA